MDTLLDWLKTNTHEIYYLFYVLSFWTGLRPSELIALTWNDIDFQNELIHVSKNRLNGVEKRVTKTLVARQVLFNPKSKQALEELRELNKHYVLLMPDTDNPFYNNKPARERFNQAILATDTRPRPSYNARHTYATMLLMSGVNPVFVANQLGHSLQMLIKTYARWINSNQDKLEIAKLNIK